MTGRSIYVLVLVHTYSSTGYTPYFLMFIYIPRLPIDVTLGITFDNRGSQPYKVYAENLQHAHDLAAENAHKKAESNKKLYDFHASPGVLLPGDCVLVRNLSPWGKKKLKDRWEDIPYFVSERFGDLPVNVVQQEGTGKKRPTHLNLLLPCHVARENLRTTVATDTHPRQRARSLVIHPDTARLANADSDDTRELDIIVVVPTEKGILDPRASPFVPSIEEDQPLDDPPPEDTPASVQETAQAAVSWKRYFEKIL